MSASSNEMKNEMKVESSQKLSALQYLVGEIAKVATTYQTSKGMFSSKAHGDDLAIMLSTAQKKLKDLEIEDTLLHDMSAERKQARQGPKIQEAYMEIVSGLEKKFSQGLNKWAKENKTILSDRMDASTVYQMYSCLHLNAAKPDAHTSSRNIGILLKDI
jgi:hypothetical protein